MLCALMRQGVFRPLWGLVRQRRLAFEPPGETLLLARIASRCAFSSASRPRTSPFICQSFADCADQDAIRAAGIINSELFTVVIPEVVLSKVAVQMLLAAMLIDAAHTALEDAEKAFDSIGVNFGIGGINVLPVAVSSAAVACVVIPQIAVGVMFIGHDGRFTSNILGHDRQDGIGASVLDNDASALPGAALQKGEDLHLVMIGPRVSAVVCHFQRPKQ